ncbi:MAG: radical SAM/SPASM domain-containing protein [Hoeflea sp.]|uniref:radical SAM/SPASM domain-containing protein n=1 Tax=Hoeflea sp. TaxID=1940281 RepID=UPI003EFA8E82
MTIAQQITATMKRISTTASEGPATDLAAQYDMLSEMMVEAGRLDEAVTALLAAKAHSSHDKIEHYHSRSMQLMEKIEEPDGILPEHRSYVAQGPRYSQYPAFVRIETMASCNAACIFCPYPKMERKGTRMSDALVEKVLADLTDIPSDHQFGISFHHMSEPLIDKRFPKYVGWVDTHLPNAHVLVNTNGSTLNAANIDFLLAARNIHEINISFNDHRAEDYEFAMKLPFGRTVANLDMLHERLEQGASKKVVVRRVGDGTEADAEFVEFCKARWPRFTAVAKAVKDFLGQIDVGPGGEPIKAMAYAEVPISGCHQWYQMTITSQGEVAICCFDGKADWVIGNVSDKHVLEVYNSDEMKIFRDRSITRLEAPEPCRSCTIFWGGRKMNPAMFVPG